ncbi:double-stranded RNA-specific editase Adar [Bicyclus anynana]|uniref:Double-stranded RNA-specific editase Adar n=1 Tax=Bicyclus anynana TaxID=110368 RepID=A0ABM3M2C5_BICAN|nr:double-stranded RNA-specific editase Adar [Bicyclus anynana]
MDRILGSNDPRCEDTNWSGVSSSTDVVMPATTDSTKRRITSIEDEPPSKKPAPTIRVDPGFKWNLQALAKAADAVGSGGKSPVSALNELGLKVQYSITRQEGPAHCPNFNVTVTVANMTFEGVGHSKREARASAARACLTALLARAGRVLPAPGPPPDFTSDEPTRYTIADLQFPETLGARPAAPAPSMYHVTQFVYLFGPLSAVPIAKSPINTLYEQYPGLNFKCTFGDGSPLDSAQAPPQLGHSMRFKVVCQIKEQVFEGYGSSKKLAKLATARAALGELCERGLITPEPVAPTSETLPQLLADHIAKIVNEKFVELMHGDLLHSRRKVLAGIVITHEYDADSAKVIAVATGTKCVSGEHISVRGQAVNDGHAEVVARRCLQRFLYAELLKYAEAEDPTAPLAASELEPVAGGGYALRAGRRLHLYVSTAPCGDGRIFSPHEQQDLQPDRHPNRLARGQLRTKIESGEGTIPVKNSVNVVQTWDGLLQGERLLTMSCSDKMARWCVVGLQGALLGTFLRPVYLHSLVLGSLLHQHHMYRALCGRIEGLLSSLPPPYQLQRPRLARALSMEARTAARAPSFSVCWASTAPMPEVINSTTGKLESGHPSLVCKQSMFARWLHLVKRLPLLAQDEFSPPLQSFPEDVDQILYCEAKLLCAPYQEAKDCLINAFDRAQLGRWIKKPVEQDQFLCEILNADPTILFA